MLPVRTLLILSASMLGLAACAAKEKPPAISYDSDDFKPAAVQPDEPKPIAIVTVPDPLPGQLLPPPSSQRPAETNSPPARVEAANKGAIQEPSAHGYINAVQVYPFTEGALYRLYAAPEQVTDITLQPGEALSSVSAGDTVRWVVGDTTSGSGTGKQAHILVKPFAPGLKTNLVIMTDRRSYHLVLESTDRTSMAAISWTYPQDQLVALRQQNERADAVAPIAENVVLADLKFRYAITGDTPPWRPVRAFDDGAHVYVEFPSRIDQGEAPPLFVVGPEGDNQLVNYRVRRNYYIVDRLFAAAELRLGQDPQQVVRISRTDTVASVSQTAQAGRGS
ncbi:MAG: P-type conjugative transfer protein TrbG [Rhodospirillales bacterium]|nr:P-type conjugative transfer protein TrbG [Rhodospirillales bacterium]